MSKFMSNSYCHTIRNITIINNSTAIVTTFPNWVVGGRCNIQVNDHSLIASLSIKDSSNNIITHIDHNDGVFSFDMPDSNITITID